MFTFRIFGFAAGYFLTHLITAGLYQGKGWEYETLRGIGGRIRAGRAFLRNEWRGMW